MSDDLLVNERDGVLEVVLNRPHKANAISDDMFLAIRDAVERFESTPSLHVLLIRAVGKLFSAGGEIGGAMPPDENRGGLDARLRYRKKFHDLFDRLEAVEKPVVVAHQGACIGGALELSLSCDFRLAAASARYSLPEYEFGVLPGAGGITRLTRLVGPHWARWMIIAGEWVSAEQAVQIGFVHAVYPDDEFAAKVDAFCARLAQGPYEMYGLAKTTIELAVDLDRAQGRNVERIANSVLFAGDEHEVSVKAYFQRMAERRAKKG